MEVSNLTEFCVRLPKLELHAHLNGSFSEKTLQDLYVSSSTTSTDNFPQIVSSFQLGDNRTLEDCFNLFKIAHAVTTTPEAIMKGTRDVISEFAADGVNYLELRTTPRSIPDLMSKKQYIQAVIDVIKDVPNFVNGEKFIIVKLLLSVNRQESVLEAEENIKEAIEAHLAYPDIVVGVDLCGRPKFGNLVKEIFPLLSKARSSGLKIVLHCAEVPNEDEVEAILKFNADRLGHGTCIHPQHGGTEKLWKLMLEFKTPLEICLTSNVKCQTVDKYENHHLGFLLPLQYPIAISFPLLPFIQTDDKGVFSTTLSKEFGIAARVFRLSAQDLCNCTEMAIKASFASPEEKELLSNKLKDFKRLEGIL